MIQNGFPIESILGPDILKDGMTEDQMLLFAHAIEAVSVRRINDQTLAFASVMADKEDKQKVTTALNAKDNVLFKFLIDYEVE